ncbi:MAG: ATP-dependent metallopeptidase FtsH/Yme1/Tma family protein, partial [Acidimicrobiales bacterium]
MSSQPPDLRPDRPDRPRGGRPGLGGADQNWRWAVIVLLALVVVALIVPSLFNRSQSQKLNYTDFLSDVNAGHVSTATVDNSTGVITGNLTNGSSYTSNGPQPSIGSDVQDMRSHNVKLTFSTPQSNGFVQLLIYIVPFLLLFLVLVWLNRRAQGQMSGIMSIG